MTRFLRSGRNWEGRSFVVNDAIHFLASQIEEAWPEKHPSDGTVASKTHDATSPNSDHRPYPFNGSGIVYALDMGEVTEDDGALLADQLLRSRDSRLRYVIHETRIFASYSTGSRPAWTWGPYTGPNPHTNHVHVSVNHTAGPGTWDIRLGEEMPPHEHVTTPGQLPAWFSEEEWRRWTGFSGTNPDTARHEFYRYDWSWVYSRVIIPLVGRIAELERESTMQAQEISALLGRVQALENQSGAGPHHHDSRYPRRGESILLP